MSRARHDQMNEARLDALGRWLKSAGADHFEIQREDKDEEILRYANNVIFQATAREITTINLRAWADGAMAEVRVRSGDEGRLKEAARLCVERARSIATVGLPPAPEPQDSTRDASVLDYCDDSIEAYLEEPRAADLGFESAFAQAKIHGVELAGRTSYGKKSVAVGNSLGMFRQYQVTETEARVIAVDATDDHISGHAAGVGRKTDAVYIPALAETAIKKALRGRKTTDIPPGAYDVILEPSAVAELLMWLGSIAFTSKSLKDRISFLKDRMGQQVCSPRLSITDDARGQVELGVPQPFDMEGTTKDKVVILEKGVARGVVWDRRSALEAGCESTGHASDGGIEFSSGPVANHLCVAGGDDDASTLLSRVERGLWITRFHYVNGLLDPPRAVMTGLTRDGTFLIEKGRLGPGVGMLRFTDSLVEAFQRIDGISRLQEAVRMNFSNDGTYLCPTLLIRNLKFTGTAEG